MLNTQNTQIELNKLEISKNIRKILNEELGNLTELNVKIEDEKHYNYFDPRESFNQEPLVVTIHAITYNITYRFVIGENRNLINKYIDYRYLVDDVCYQIKSKIFEELFKEFKKGKIDKNISLLFKRFNLDEFVLLKAFDILNIMLINKDNTINILKSFNYQNKYNQRYNYNQKFGDGVIDLDFFRYNSIKTDRERFIYLNDVECLELLYKQLIIDSMSINYDVNFRGVMPKYYYSLLDICSISKDIIELIKIQNKF